MYIAYIRETFVFFFFFLVCTFKKAIKGCWSKGKYTKGALRYRDKMTIDVLISNNLLFSCTIDIWVMVTIDYPIICARILQIGGSWSTCQLS